MGRYSGERLISALAVPYHRSAGIWPIEGRPVWVPAFRGAIFRAPSGRRIGSVGGCLPREGEIQSPAKKDGVSGTEPSAVQWGESFTPYKYPSQGEGDPRYRLAMLE